MKKLLMIVAVLMTAGMTQAASIAWGAAIAMSDGSTPVPTGSLVYLLYSTSAFVDTPVTFDIGDTRTVATHTMTAGEAAIWVFTDTWSRADASGGVNGYYRYVVATTGLGGQFAYLDTPQLTGITDSTGAGDITINTGWGGAEYVGSNLGGTVVPEPTSMALFAFGVAALGLRRRFRK